MPIYNSIMLDVSNQVKSSRNISRAYNKYAIKPSQKYKSKCTLSLDEFKKIASKVHGNKYDYALVNFKNRGDRISIICPYHGKYTKSVGDHIRGKGCRACEGSYRGISRSSFINICNTGVGSLYILLCNNDCELFYKIGITSTDIKTRFSQRNSMPYNFEILYEIVHSPDAIYDLEKILHKSLEKYRYLPTQKFGGRTECFSTIEPIISLLNKIKIIDNT